MKNAFQYVGMFGDAELWMNENGVLINALKDEHTPVTPDELREIFNQAITESVSELLHNLSKLSDE